MSLSLPPSEFLELKHDQRVTMLIEKYKSRPWVFANNLDEIEARTLVMLIIDTLNEEDIDDLEKAKKIVQLIQYSIKDMAVKESIEVGL